MSETGERSVAEKLAAAKRKHKAYLKEKNLKNGNKPKEQVEENPINSSITEPVFQNAEIPPENNNFPPQTDVYEPDLPLPQYSYDTQPQVSSLPDPLSFFDNLNVGATFQNFAQPIASFFNNSNENPSTNDVIELPNQICVEENVPFTVNTENIQTSTDQSTQGFISYDRFKIDAIKPASSNVETKVNEEKKVEMPQIPVFDEFTNADKSVNVFQNQETYSYDNIEPFFQNISQPTHYNNEENNLNVDKIDGTKQITTVSFEVNASSNLQTLQRISNEMDELLKQDENSPYLKETKSNEELEKQNGELALQLDKQNVKCLQLSSELHESESRYSKLLTEFKRLEIQKEDTETTARLHADIEIQNELSKLREDLQCHLQTISMLVAEKTELSTLLNETQSALKTQSSEFIDLQHKMKEAKLFYATVEHELEQLRSEKLNLNSTQKEQADVFTKISQDYGELKRRHDELSQDLLESMEKLRTANETNAILQNQAQELRGQLSLANIKIQQLTLDSTAQQDDQIEKLMQEKFDHEKQISILNDTLKTISKEREESSLQYQQYAEQLNGQITNLVAKLEQYQRENEQLKIQEEHRVRHIGDLEKQLQNAQSDSTSLNLQRSNSSLKKELENSLELVKNLQSEKDEISANLAKALIDKELMEKELETCKFSIGQLEITVEQLKGSQPDNAVLLATMESDKVAASRAISQNTELKRQMEGMQEVLLKVNNDNVQLTEHITLERQTNRDLLEKLQKTEINFQTLATAIEIKDKELTNMREQLEKINRQIVQQEQLSDRLRHYEAQDHSSQSLQNELQDSKQMIAHLTNELNILKQNQLNQPIQFDQNDRNDVMNELRAQLNKLQIRNKELESVLNELRAGDVKSTDTNGNENLDKETAMKHLEKKFLKTMEEIAILTEEKQRLEHLVLQLQGETETIGAYVTLYQQQRSILKQRALEKDQQIQQLTSDREVIKGNLDRLNNLVNKLIVEKGAITKELLEEHQHFSKERDDLCAEHQKIHREINKITSDGLKKMDGGDNSNTQIAEEIISLLSEIKSSNLVQPTEAIHHCPWCSGKLITV